MPLRADNHVPSHRSQLTSQPQEGNPRHSTKQTTKNVPGKNEGERRSRLGSLLTVRDANARGSKSSISSQDGETFFTAAKDKGSNNSYNYRKSKVYRNSSKSYKENVVPQVLLPKDEDGSSPSLRQESRKEAYDALQATSLPLDGSDKQDVNDEAEIIIVKDEDDGGLPDGVVNVHLNEGLYEYSQEAFVYLKDVECFFSIPTDYLDNSTSITKNMRMILVDWLIQVQHHLRLSQESLYLSVGILDYVLHKRDVDPDKLQLVGITSLLIATKIEEYYPAEINKLLHLTENSYSRVDVINMERVLLQILEFKAYIPSPQIFLLRYARAALKCKDDQFYETCSFIVDTHLVLPHHSCILPSELAGSAVLLAQLLYNLSSASGGTYVSPSAKEIWTPTLEFFTNLSLSDLLPTSLEMVKQMILSCAEDYKFRGVIGKYQSFSRHKRLALASHVQEDVLKKAKKTILAWI